MSNSTKEGLYFFLTNDLDRKYLYAEVYYGDFSICDVDTEKGSFSVSFSADPRMNPGHAGINVSLEKFIATLEKAKEELKKFPNGLE